MSRTLYFIAEALAAVSVFAAPVALMYLGYALGY